MFLVTAARGRLTTKSFDQQPKQDKIEWAGVFILVLLWAAGGFFVALSIPGFGFGWAVAGSAIIISGFALLFGLITRKPAFAKRFIPWMIIIGGGITLLVKIFGL